MSSDHKNKNFLIFNVSTLFKVQVKEQLPNSERKKERKKERQKERINE